MKPQSQSSYRSLFVGVDVSVPLLDGSSRTYVNLDNAASTPSFVPVLQAVNNFLPYYSSVHRGTGFKSQLSTHVYEQARHTVLDFLGANSEEHVCIFGKNTTEAINKLARRFPFTSERNIVITSEMEHHSNDLPWRGVAHPIYVSLTADGKLDEADFDTKIARYAGKIALVAISGASNVTGTLNPIHRLAEKAHAVGAQFLADCAQLAPHRKIEMRPLDDPGHLDYVAISAHKMYAPFGTGALVGRRDTFESGIPDLVGGGTIDLVTLDQVTWAQPPDRDEAGSPNTIGAVALAAAIHQLQAIGMDQVALHEAELTEYALRRLSKMPGVIIYGSKDANQAAERLGVIPVELEGISHFKVAAILGYEFGIGVRSGCFCAHPYIMHILGLKQEDRQSVRQRMLAGDRSQMPGMIRASFGLYNTIEDVDALIEALDRIQHNDYKGTYVQDVGSGEYSPANWQPVFKQYFEIE